MNALLLHIICHKCSVLVLLLLTCLFLVVLYFPCILCILWLLLLCILLLKWRLHGNQVSGELQYDVFLLEVLILLLQSVGGIFFSFISIISLILFNKYSVLSITSSITEFSFPCSLVHSTLHLCSSALTNLIRPVKTGGWSAVAPPQDFCQIWSFTKSQW